MPIYEYKCPACGTIFEELVRTERGTRDLACPQCGERKITRKPSVFSTHSAPTRHSEQSRSCGQCSADGSCPLDD